MEDIIERLRAEVSSLAGEHNLEILEKAQRRLNCSRFKRLRQWKTSPQTPDEEAYVYHLHEYISAKLQIRRIERGGHSSFFRGGLYSNSVSYRERLAKIHRYKMQEIEDKNGVDIAHVLFNNEFSNER